MRTNSEITIWSAHLHRKPSAEQAVFVIIVCIVMPCRFCNDYSNTLYRTAEPEPVFTLLQFENKLDKLNDQSRKDDVVMFEELGVDRLFVDESHYYKNRAKRCA